MSLWQGIGLLPISCHKTKHQHASQALGMLVLYGYSNGQACQVLEGI